MERTEDTATDGSAGTAGTATEGTAGTATEGKAGTAPVNKKFSVIDDEEEFVSVEWFNKGPGGKRRVKLADGQGEECEGFRVDREDGKRVDSVDGLQM